jgi:hypothetical protein
MSKLQVSQASHQKGLLEATLSSEEHKKQFQHRGAPDSEDLFRIKVSKDILLNVDLIVVDHLPLTLVPHQVAAVLNLPATFAEESVTLHFASFETDCSGYEEEKEKIGKFTQFHAIS